MKLRDARLKLEKVLNGRKSDAVETAIRALDALESLEDFFVDNAVCMERGIRKEDAETYKNIVKLYIRSVEDEQEETISEGE